MSERTTQRTCGRGGVTIRVLTDRGYQRMQGWLANGDPLVTIDPDAVKRMLRHEVEETVVDECPVIDTDVVVYFQRYGPREGIERWTCPVCQFEHEEEVGADDD